MATGAGPALEQTPEGFRTDSLPLEEQIRQRAHEIWLQRGQAGSDVMDWLEAEAQILGELENK